MNPMGPGDTFSSQVRSASSVSPKLNSPPPMRVSQPEPGDALDGRWHDVDLVLCTSFIRRFEALTRPLSPSLPPPAGREGRRARFGEGASWFFKTNHSLFSRRKGGRLGEEGRGDEGSTPPDR